MARGKRPVPFRTRKLSLLAPMVLHGRLCGRVGRRRTSSRRGSSISVDGPRRMSGAVSEQRRQTWLNSTRSGRARAQSARRTDRTARGVPRLGAASRDGPVRRGLPAALVVTRRSLGSDARRRAVHRSPGRDDPRAPVRRRPVHEPATGLPDQAHRVPLRTPIVAEGERGPSPAPPAGAGDGPTPRRPRRGARTKLRARLARAPAVLGRADQDSSRGRTARLRPAVLLGVPTRPVPRGPTTGHPEEQGRFPCGRPGPVVRIEDARRARCEAGRTRPAARGPMPGGAWTHRAAAARADEVRRHVPSGCTTRAGTSAGH